MNTSNINNVNPKTTKSRNKEENVRSIIHKYKKINKENQYHSFIEKSNVANFNKDSNRFNQVPFQTIGGINVCSIFLIYYRAKIWERIQFRM